MSFRVCLGAAIALTAQSAHALDPAWLAKANASISALEYAPTMTADKAVMNNRTQGFRSEAIADRVEVRSREHGTALVALTLERFGRDGAWVTPGGETQAVNGDRLEIRRSDIVEWFVNRPSGLEQGFDLAQRPRGDGELVLAIDTDHARLSLDGDQVLLDTASGTLRYSKLVAFDSTGAYLPATMSVRGDNIELRIDDSQATYPLVIDPILTGTFDDTLLGSQAGAELGRSAAIVGDVNFNGFPDIVIGAPEWDGAVGIGEGAWFLFLGSATGFPAAPSASVSGQQVDAKLGSSIAALGDTNGDGLDDFAVAAPFQDTSNPGQNFGQVTIYYGRSNLVFNTTVIIGTQLGEFLGSSVAGAGDVNGDGYPDVVVGSLGFDGGATNSGRAQVFPGGIAGISTTALAALTTGSSDIRFGSAVAGVGDVNADGFADMLIGAPEFESTGTETNEGAAFLYLGGAPFNSIIDATLQINQTEARFGSSLSGGGDVNGDGYSDMLVGAPLHDNGTTDGGSAFLYFGAASPSSSPSPNVTYSGSQTGADFGRAVSILGDINGDGYSDVAVSAPLFESAAAQNDEGLVNVYVGAASSPPAIPIVSIQSNEAGARLGTALHGGLANRDGYADLLVGAALADPTAALADAGAGYLYFGGPRLPNETASTVVSGTQGSSFQGWSLAVGDFNADGIGDFATGLFGHDAVGAQNAGAVRLFRGRAATQGGPVALPLIEFNQADARFGASVALGDLNSDGYSDLLVGAPFYSNGQTEEGAAMIFFSNAGTFSATPSVILQSNVAGARAGTSVAVAGDINGDGNVDILVGAPNVSAGLGNQGAAYVYLNQGGSFAATPSVTFNGGQANALFGTTVAGLGDVNGDGRADIGIGAPGFTDIVANAGQLRVYYGSANFNPTAADFIKTGAGISGRFASALAGADVNGDGFSDLFAGAPDYTVDQNTEGAAFLYLGSAQGLDPVPNARIESNQLGARLGGSIASAGDLNDDGAADIIVGVTEFDDAAADQGAGFVYLGTRGGAFNSTVDLVLEGATTAVARSGFSVASGDINGDGVADLLMGVINEDPPGVTDAGAVRIYPANLSGQLQARSANYSGAPGVAIDAWGVSNVGNGFVVNGTAFSVRGRERTKLEVEACPAGQPFGGGNCIVESGVDWRQILPTGTALTTVVLVPEGMYHWRARNLYLPSVAGTGDVTLVEAGPWRRRLGGADVIDVRVTDNLFRNGFEN